MSEWNYSRLGHLINIDVVVIIRSMVLTVAPQHWSIVAKASHCKGQGDPVHACLHSHSLNPSQHWFNVTAILSQSFSSFVEAAKWRKKLLEISIISGGIYSYLCKDSIYSGSW